VRHLFLIVTLASAFGASALQAAPITSSNGPGGVDTGIVAWFKADALNLSGGSPVATWTDSSGNGNDASETVVSEQPTLQAGVQNGLPVVRFDGGDRLETPETGAYSGDQAHSVIGAFSVNNFGSGSHHNPLYGIGSNPGTNQRHNVHLSLENATTMVNRLEGGAITYATSVGSTLRTLANFYPGGGSTGDYELEIDGTAQNKSGNAAAHDFLTGELVLGDQSNGSQTGLPNFDGDIAELAFFNRGLNGTERVIVDNYLAAKYDKTTGGSGAIANDLYAGDESTNGNFDNDVFGVAQIAGSPAVLNAGAAGFGIEISGGLTDGESVFAGHSDPIGGVTSDDLGLTDLDLRWSRVWTLDKREVDGIDASLSFNFEDAGLGTGPQIADAVLLFRSGLTGDFTDLGITPTVENGSFVFSLTDLQLTNGQFTLGLTVPEPSSGVLFAGGLMALIGRRRRRRQRRGKLA